MKIKQESLWKMYMNVFWTSINRQDEVVVLKGDYLKKFYHGGNQPEHKWPI
jgi:hypothetical protein